MGRLSPVLVWLLIILSSVPSVAAQDPGEVGETVGPVLRPVVDTVLPPAENETGQDLHSEEIDIEVVLDAVNLEYQLLGILFGGGKVQADLIVDASLAFHAVSTMRLDDALQAASGDANVTLNGTFGVPTDRLALTAEEIRLIGGGQLLAAFQEQQERVSKRLIEETVVGVTVLTSRFQWTGTAPGASLEPTLQTDPDAPDVRDPPITLMVAMRLQFLDRYSLGSILGTALAEEESRSRSEKDQDALQRRIEENQTLPFMERSAFQVLGFSQLLAFTVPPGWDVSVELLVPAGFTVEGATDALLVSKDRTSARYSLSGDGRSDVASQAAVATLSSRGTVTFTLLGMVVLAGLVVRTVTEVGVFSWLEHRDRRAGAPYKRPTLWRRLRQSLARSKAKAK